MIIRAIKEVIFGVPAKGEPASGPNKKFYTTKYENKPEFNDWCRSVNMSASYVHDRHFVNNVHRKPCATQDINF